MNSGNKCALVGAYVSNLISKFSENRTEPGGFKLPVNLLAPESAVLLEAHKGLIRRTIESYSLPWIVINETLQNALDAVEKGETTEGNIKVKFNLSGNRVEIIDNGRGFPFNPDLNLFFWGITDKESDPDRRKLLGYQGVGMKVVMFSSSDFDVHTVNSGRKWRVNVENAHQYESCGEVIPEVSDPTDTDEPSGSSIIYTFPDDKVQQFFRYIFEKYAGKIGDNLGSTSTEKYLFAIEHYFRVYTYAGNLDRLLGLLDAPKKSTIEMQIFWSDIPSGLPEGLRNILEGSTSPLTLSFENKHWDLEEILNRVKAPYRRRVPSPISFPMPPSGYSARHGPRYVYVNKLTSVTEYQSLITNTRARRSADTPYYQTYLFPRLRGIYLVVGARSVLSEYLFGDLENQQFICAQSGVPTEHKIREPSDGGELGYLPNIYLALSTNAKLNYGKRQITDPWLKGYVNKFFEDAFRLTLRDLARAFVGRLRPPTPPQIASTNLVGRNDVTTLPGIAKVPHDENMVIAIFYELIGLGLVNGIRTYHLSRNTDPYDGKIVMKSGNTFPTPTDDTHLKTLEFKIRIGDLINELNRGYKMATAMDLVVVWEDDYSALPITTQLPDYGIEEAHYEDFPEVSKKLVCRNIPLDIPIIVLKEIIHQKFGRI